MPTGVLSDCAVPLCPGVSDFRDSGGKSAGQPATSARPDVPSNDQIWTHALDTLTGGAVSSFFTGNTTAGLVGIENDATGSPSGTQVTPANNVSGTRRTWIQLR